MPKLQEASVQRDTAKRSATGVESELTALRSELSATQRELERERRKNAALAKHLAAVDATIADAQNAANEVMQDAQRYVRIANEEMAQTHAMYSSRAVRYAIKLRAVAGRMLPPGTRRRAAVAGTAQVFRPRRPASKR